MRRLIASSKTKPSVGNAKPLLNQSVESEDTSGPETGSEAETPDEAGVPAVRNVLNVSSAFSSKTIARSNS